MEGDRLLIGMGVNLRNAPEVPTEGADRGRTATCMAEHGAHADDASVRSEEHTSELQSLMRISYAVVCLKKKQTHTHKREHHPNQDESTQHAPNPRTAPKNTHPSRTHNPN